MSGKSYELVILLLLVLTVLVDGFSTQLRPLSSCPLCMGSSHFRGEAVILMAAGKKKRRRRKKLPASAAPEPEQGVSPEAATLPTSPSQSPIDQILETAEDIDAEDVDVDQLADIANFKFEGAGEFIWYNHEVVVLGEEFAQHFGRSNCRASCTTARLRGVYPAA